MKHFSSCANCVSRATKLRATLAVLCLVIVVPLQIAGQKGATIAAKVNPTPDALVFGDRDWVYYLAANSSVPRKLAKGNFPALSPDRQRVAYCLPQNSDASAPAAATVMLVDLNTGKTTTVLRANAWISHLRWSPNSERISFTLAFCVSVQDLSHRSRRNRLDSDRQRRNAGCVSNHPVSMRSVPPASAGGSNSTRELTAGPTCGTDFITKFQAIAG